MKKLCDRLGRSEVSQYFSYGKIKLYYEDGWFVLEDGIGRCSVISEQKARDVELEPVLNGARQDVDRGGAPWEYAFRGIEIIEENGTRKYKLPSYEADKMIRSAPPVEIKGRFEIPARVGNHIINMVWDEAFMECAELEEVILPEKVTFIGDSAFSKCSALRSINIPRGLTRVGIDPFQETKLETDRDPANPVFIMDHVLVKADPSIRGEYVVPEHITVIADYGFQHCRQLTKLVIPDQVAYIGNGAFYDCRSLTQIVLPKKVKEFSPVFSNCDNLEEVVLPEGITSISSFAFYGCDKLKKITIPQSVQKIDSMIFGGRPAAEVEFAGISKEILNPLFSQKPVRKPSGGPVMDASGFETLSSARSDNPGKNTIKHILTAVSIFLILLILLVLILIRMDGYVRHKESAEHVPYSSDMGRDTFSELTIVSCEQFSETESAPA